jgi:hypothetical protein
MPLAQNNKLQIEKFWYLPWMVLMHSIFWFSADYTRRDENQKHKPGNKCMEELKNNRKLSYHFLISYRST